MVWNIDRDGAWEKRIPTRDGAPFRPLWAPEIAFIKGAYWICYSIPLGVGGGVLKSASGKPEGPYKAMFQNAPAVNAIDLALFADDDGKVYLLWGAGNKRTTHTRLQFAIAGVEAITSRSSAGAKTSWQRKEDAVAAIAAVYQVIGNPWSHHARKSSENAPRKAKTEIHHLCANLDHGKVNLLLNAREAVIHSDSDRIFARLCIFG